MRKIRFGAFPPAALILFLSASGAQAQYSQSQPGKVGAPAQESKAPSAESQNPQVLMKTNMGDFTIELYADKAPKTVENFLSYVNEGFYDGLVFHRIISNFMIQGGGFDKDLRRMPTHDPVQNEADNGLSNERGTIAMARTSDPHSASSQFFINVQDNPGLDFQDKKAKWGYCVFGKVVEGMDVVDKIKAVPVGRKGPHQHFPKTPVVIEEASVVGEESTGE
jgi:cyclophilin family peptidyl-prolyl cis-trans isomerase